MVIFNTEAKLNWCVVEEWHNFCRKPGGSITRWIPMWLKWVFNRIYEDTKLRLGRTPRQTNLNCMIFQVKQHHNKNELRIYHTIEDDLHVLYLFLDNCSFQIIMHKTAYAAYCFYKTFENLV